MIRFFLFSIKELDYEKNDLNVPISTKRLILGKLSRLVTNTIFLSHALREHIVIRILVSEPIKYLIQIKSETIRYLGPEERSLGSILLKVKKSIEDKIQQNSMSKNWFEPNPGVLVKITENFLEDIENELKEPSLFIKITNNQLEKNTNFFDLENELTILKQNYESVIFHFNLNVELDLLKPLASDISNQFKCIEINFTKKLDTNKLVSIINIVFDNIEIKK
ncbi:MAG: hypothetical protein ACFFDW_06930 [Candidatus Thorarchaeota archaeon]